MSGTVEREWLKRAERYCFRGRLDRHHYEGPVFERGEGSVVWDVEGRAYLDFNSGQLCSVLGHSPPRVVAAVAEAARTLIHASSTYYNTREIELAEKLSATLPPSLGKCLFALSGSDATEAAINIAKKATGRLEVASPHLGFHGLADTPRSLSFGAFHAGAPSAAPGSFALMGPYCLRCPINHTYPECDLVCLSASLEVLDAETTSPIAAIITEPIFSAGGVIEPPPGWLAAVQKACHERGALLILDESQTGIAKLGSMWGFEQHGIVPDVITVSKHFGGGVPISAVVTSPEIEERALANGFLYAHSHGSDPLGCAAAVAALTMIEEEHVVEKVREVGDYLRRLLESLASSHECIVEVRGRGLLQAIELQDVEGGPGFEIGPRVAAICLERGLIAGSVRRRGSVIRFTPPVTTTPEQLDRAAEILDDALALAWAESHSSHAAEARR